MGYDYEKEKPELLTNKGQRCFLKVRDRANYLLREAGAFRAQEVWKDSGCVSSWQMLACVDRLLELGEVRELTGKDVWGQHRVFIGARD